MPSSIPYNGNYVVISHTPPYDDVERKGFTSRYLHLRDVPNVSAGEEVVQGELLGYMGKTGTEFTHLHFGLRYDDSGEESRAELQNLKIDNFLLGDFVQGDFYQSTNVER